MRRGHLLALSEACLVTFLWSSSYVLVKIVSMALVFGGVLMVQIRNITTPKSPTPTPEQP